MSLKVCGTVGGAKRKAVTEKLICRREREEKKQTEYLDLKLIESGTVTGIGPLKNRQRSY